MATKCNIINLQTQTQKELEEETVENRNCSDCKFIEEG
jgi:hypothetical protein